ncbi:hypothetical protein KCV07_g9848, partial [Aureobasidium melanogenum]
MEQPLKKLLMMAGMLSTGARSLASHRRHQKRAVWYLQHGDSERTNPDSLFMSEIGLQYQYFDYNVNVAVMAKEIAQALDNEAEAHGDFSKPGSKYRHARDPTGARDWSIYEFPCYNLAKACDSKDLVDDSSRTYDKILSYHTSVCGREDYHPDMITEMSMGISGHLARKPRVWFVHGPNPWSTRTIQARCPFEGIQKGILIAESIPLNDLSEWVRQKVGATPAHGSPDLPSTPPLFLPTLTRTSTTICDSQGLDCPPSCA